jgi:site-specific DNA-methyltransferase (adenine-specific)
MEAALRLEEQPGIERNGRLILGDCSDVLSTVPHASFALAVADAPYGIGLDEWDVLHANTNSALGGSSPAQQKAGAVFARRGKPINGWAQADREIPRQYYDWCTSWATELHRVVRPGASVFVFAGRRFAHRCICALEDAGFNFRDLIGWKRPAATHRAQRLSVVYERRGLDAAAEAWEGWRLGNLRPVYEPIIWCAKPYRHTVADNVLEHGVGAYNETVLRERLGHADNLIEARYRRGERGLHPAQKPVELLRTLIETTTRPGDLVLDPFAGSGSTGVACEESGRRYVLVEISSTGASVAAERLGLPIESSWRGPGSDGDAAHHFEPSRQVHTVSEHVG